MLAWRRALHFAPDRSLPSELFSRYEASDYGGENSIDVRSIPREDGTYDFVSLSQVLDFVREDRAAFAEIARIASEVAIVHLAFTSAMSHPRSDHYSEPSGRHGRMHEYGRDVFEHLRARYFGFAVLEVTTTDSSTGVTQPAYLLTRQKSDALTLEAVSGTTFPTHRFQSGVT
jgi:hypothetical protein